MIICFKTIRNMFTKISGFLRYQSLRLFGRIPRHNTYRIPVILKEDLDFFIDSGEPVQCLVCGNILTKKDIGTMVAYEGKYRFCCKSIACQDKLRGQRYE